MMMGATKMMTGASGFTAEMTDWREVGSPSTSPVIVASVQLGRTAASRDIYIGVIGRASEDPPTITEVLYGATAMTNVSSTSVNTGSTVAGWWTVTSISGGTEVTIKITTNVDLTGLTLCCVSVINGTLTDSISDGATPINAPSGSTGHTTLDLASSGIGFILDGFHGNSLATWTVDTSFTELDSYAQSGITTENYYIHRKQVSAADTAPEHRIYPLAEGLQDWVQSGIAFGPV